MPAETLSVHILGKDYQVTCPLEERDNLLKAAAELDRRMQNIRQAGHVIGVERIAVMAALNLSDEVLKKEEELRQKQKSDHKTSDNERLLAELHRRIDQALLQT